MTTEPITAPEPPAAATAPDITAQIKSAVEAAMKETRGEVQSLRTQLGQSKAREAAIAKDRGWSDEDLAEAKATITSYDALIDRGIKAGIPEADLKAVKPGALAAYVDGHSGSGAPTSAVDEIVAKVTAAMKGTSAATANLAPGATAEPMGSRSAVSAMVAQPEGLDEIVGKNVNHMTPNQLVAHGRRLEQLVDPLIRAGAVRQLIEQKLV